MASLPEPPAVLAEKLCDLGRLLRGTVWQARGEKRDFAGVARQSSADTIYQLDTHVEPILEDFCARWSRDYPIILIAEGAVDAHGNEGQITFPAGADPTSAAIRLIVDPIDGTRGLMYDKRSAWFLAGIAPNHGDATRLSDIAVAAQVEIPTSKQEVSDVIWAARGQGAHAVRDDLGRNTSTPFALKPSTAKDLAHGFAAVASFFPGTKQAAGALMEHIVAATIGDLDVTRPMVFDDQYISTGGQLYELMVGHDRFVADLRPALYHMAGMPVGLSVHPYDVCTMLIAREAGVIVTDETGGALDGPLDVETPLSWMGFANETLRALIVPAVREFFAQGGVAPGGRNVAGKH